ncbi:Macrophage mannose receptor 1 [Araneus ventricosus]|uniref:Macrophage mannose receptor 1 n=1 Tax=Araneus ventricosus TaxID=182803 RepID=A0A4Y2QZ15_ARAVE|nr:Macrophage mannose receptor 1 [Araneus ventricosus]
MTTLYIINLHPQEESKFGTVNGKRLKISNWLAEQPKLVSSFMDNCVAMNAQGKWVVRSCREKLSFVCEWNLDSENEITVDETHLCPNSYGWQDIGGDLCVKTSFVRKTWNDAMYDCFQHGGSLVTFHSSKDLHYFVEYVNTNYRYTSVHIGLGRRKDGSYMWADYTPVDFTAWDPDDPPSTVKDCVELDMRTEKWKKVHAMMSEEIFSAPLSKIEIGRTTNVARIGLRRAGNENTEMEESSLR